MGSLGLEVPFHIDGAGRVAATPDPRRQVELRLRHLIATMPFERVMRDNYGSGIGALLFDVNDPLQLSALMSSLGDSLRVWEPNVVLDDISIVSQDPAGGGVELTVSYHQRTGSVARTFNIVVGSTATYGWPEGG
jgi:Bacteriophage baseplate protein W